MVININNLDTEKITIDTYGMFTGDGFEECELDYLQEQNPGTNYDDYEWTYNHPEIVKDLAHASIEIVRRAIKYTEYEKIINSITYVSSGSPRFYNYTTDHYIMSVDYNLVELHNYTFKNYDDIHAIAQKYNTEVTDEDRLYAAIINILDNCISDDDYKMSMWDAEHEIYSNNVNIEPVTKK